MLDLHVARIAVAVRPIGLATSHIQLMSTNGIYLFLWERRELNVLSVIQCASRLHLEAIVVTMSESAS